MSNVYIKTKIRSGHYAMEYLRKIRKKKILVVCDRFMVDSGSIHYVLDALDSSNETVLFDQAVPDPTIQVVGKGIHAACRLKPQIVIGFGGGSAIDTAKGIIYFSNQKGLFEKPQFVTIPTTSGTGAEVTSAAVITDPETKTKHLISSDDILADVAILDPRLTLSVPPAITANTGMDVLTHALEAYVSAGANVFSDALSEKAVELLIQSLLTCYQNGKNLEARTQMHEASTLAGMSFNTAGLGLNHSMAHQLGGMFHIPHGLANALLLREVIDFNSVSHDIMQKYAALSYKVRLTGIDSSPEDAVKALKALIVMLMDCMGMPDRVEKTGVLREDYFSQIQNMVDNAQLDNCLPSNPREVRALDIQSVFERIF